MLAACLLDAVYFCGGPCICDFVVVFVLSSGRIDLMVMRIVQYLRSRRRLGVSLWEFWWGKNWRAKWRPLLTAEPKSDVASYAKVAMLRFNPVRGKTPSTPRRLKSNHGIAKSVMVKSLWSALFYLCTADKSPYHYNPDPGPRTKPLKPPIPMKKTTPLSSSCPETLPVYVAVRALLPLTPIPKKMTAKKKGRAFRSNSMLYSELTIKSCVLQKGYPATSSEAPMQTSKNKEKISDVSRQSLPPTPDQSFTGKSPESMGKIGCSSSTLGTLFHAKRETLWERAAESFVVQWAVPFAAPLMPLTRGRA